MRTNSAKRKKDKTERPQLSHAFKAWDLVYKSLPEPSCIVFPSWLIQANFLLNFKHCEALMKFAPCDRDIFKDFWCEPSSDEAKGSVN